MQLIPGFGAAFEEAAHAVTAFAPRRPDDDPSFELVLAFLAVFRHPTASDDEEIIRLTLKQYAEKGKDVGAIQKALATVVHRWQCERLIGHSVMELMKTYGHALPEMQQEVAAKVGAVLWGR